MAKAVTKPRDLKQPQIKSDITVPFINQYFSYQIKLAKYNLSVDDTKANKEALDAAKKSHKDWLVYVDGVYNGKVTEAKTKKIINQFIKNKYPKLPKAAKLNTGAFK